MNIRIWRYAPEPPALKGVSPQIYAIRHIGRATIGLAYTSFFHYIKYISHGRLGPCCRCTGAYPRPFFHLLLFGVLPTALLWTHLITLCNQLFVIRYFHYFDNYYAMCIPILWYVSSYFIIRYLLWCCTLFLYFYIPIL